MKKNELTPKQEKFCQLYIELGNASEAYRQAYNAKNMNPESIKVNASKLLKSANVALTVKELKAEHKERHIFNVDTAHAQYVEAYNLAKMKEKTESMIAATKAQCELHGIEPAKEIKHSGSVSFVIEG